MATRDSAGKVLNVLAQNVPWLIGGSADLATSDRTRLKFDGAGDFQPGSYGGRNLHFGVREHAMGAALNGMAVSKLRPYGGTFFNFNDYMKPAVRLAALMEIPVDLYLHARLDRLGRRRSHCTSRSSNWRRCARCPDLLLLRPADANEVVEAWKIIMQLTSMSPRPWY